MTDGVTVTLETRLRWWVRPLIGAAARLGALGVPVNADALGKWIADHGVRLTVVR